MNPLDTLTFGPRADRPASTDELPPEFLFVAPVPRRVLAQRVELIPAPSVPDPVATPSHPSPEDASR